MNRSRAMKTSRDQRFVIRRIQLIAGDLFLEESIIWLVGIERLYDVVAITPRLRPLLVQLIAVGVGVARYIQPAQRPPLAIVGRCDQAVHYFLVGIRTLVAQEGVDLARP